MIINLPQYRPIATNQQHKRLIEIQIYALPEGKLQVAEKKQ
jgi:hypothetical protein